VGTTRKQHKSTETAGLDPRFLIRTSEWKIGVRSILLALSFRVKKVKRYVAYYLPVAERILCLISGFSRKTHSARFKTLFTPVRISVAWP
jgi:hypothetical protein